MRLLDYQKDIYSQSGEDGILGKILEILPNCNKWCVEFGAWDGTFLSNTCHLIESAGYSAVMIEYSKERFQDLLKRHGSNPKVIGLNAMVGFTAEDSLDTLLARTPIPEDFDVLSIDIDGNDYHTWNATAAYKPKVVVIEFNPTIPSEYEFVQEPDMQKSEGCSVLSLVLLGKAKGYELVAVTSLNAIFVRVEYLPLFHIANNDLKTLREDHSRLTYLISTYDGKVRLMGYDRMPWHDIKYRWLLRQIPKKLQVCPPYYNPTQKFLLKQYKSVMKRWYPA